MGVECCYILQSKQLKKKKEKKKKKKKKEFTKESQNFPGAE